jgi:hypothetical protein
VVKGWLVAYRREALQWSNGVISESSRFSILYWVSFPTSSRQAINGTQDSHFEFCTAITSPPCISNRLAAKFRLKTTAQQRSPNHQQTYKSQQAASCQWASSSEHFPVLWNIRTLQNQLELSKTSSGGNVYAASLVRPFRRASVL